MTTRRISTLLSIAALAAVLVLGATGCTRVVTVSGSQMPDTLTAQGNGKVPASPDTATMSFGVTAEARDVRNALAQASKVATAISGEVQKAGIAKTDIQTQSIGVFPTYFTDPATGRQGVSGYQANISVNVKVRQVISLGTVIAAADSAGANTISGPDFSISDPTPYQEEATRKAVDDARRQANAMAKAAGKKVGPIIAITAQQVSTGPIPLAASKDLASVPVEPGKLDVESSVLVVFSLE